MDLINHSSLANEICEILDMVSNGACWESLMKNKNIYKGKLDYQSEFSHRFACWANNHNGWAKMKKDNKRIAKKRLKREWKSDVASTILEDDERDESILC